MAKTATSLAGWLSRLQAVYYVVTGFWPLLSIGTFQLVTGRKRDLWLVKSSGALIGVAGLSLGLASRRPAVEADVVALGAGSALALGAVDVVYASRGTISPIYFGDAAVEAGFVAAWLVSCLRGRAN